MALEMPALRALVCHHRRLALGLVLLTLAIKALVPGGYMISAQSRTLTVEICGDASGGRFTTQITTPARGDHPPGQSQHGAADSACAYSALAMASLTGADPLLLAAALVFLIALGFLPLAPARLRRSFYLHPPLRGPPAFA